MPLCSVREAPNVKLKLEPAWLLESAGLPSRDASLVAKLLATTSQGTTKAPLCNNTNRGSNLTLYTHTLRSKLTISTFFTRASSARSQMACLHLQMVDGARLGSWGMRSTEDSTCSVQGLRGGRKSGWPWCLIQLITRWSQSRRLEREAGLRGIPPLIPKFDKIS